MRGAGIAPREASIPIRSALIAIVVCVAGVLAPAAAASTPTSTTLDFSRAGQGPFNQSYFSGVSFTEGTFVGYIQGDEALVGPVAGSTKDKFSSISASFAPAGQGTATYRLTAYSGSGKSLGSSSITVTQDTGDPETGPFDYVQLELGPLPKKAGSFRLSNTFVRSSYPHITLIEFGVSSITLSG